MSNYSDLLIYQYIKKPKAKATIDAIMGEYDKLADNAIDLLNQWDIDQARGFSLDIIGRRVGVSRTLPSVYRDWETDRKSTRLNSSHSAKSRMPSSA